MCGIAGIKFKNREKPVDSYLLKRMSDSMRHRGPDDEGFFIQGNIGLAHRRLSIIDLSGGHQPISNREENLTIVFNGEIYNHELLRKDLMQRGCAYTTRSDTETILHAYSQYGFDCVNYLRGMFAFCIYDYKEGLLFLARDRIGKKPIYYYHDNHVFLFASEAKALFESLPIEKEVNLRMLDFFLSVGYGPGQESLFKNIYKLEPGHTLILDRNHRLGTREYWDIREIPAAHISYEDAKTKLKAKLQESIRIRLMSEVPLGVFLSGGLDSSIIVGLMSEVVSDPIRTFSVGYENQPESSELEYARIIAKQFRTNHHEFILKPDDLFESIEVFLEHCDEPLVESAGIALLKLARLAKKEATVLLSGEGSDEIFAGYPIYGRMAKLEMLYRVFGPFSGPIRKISSEFFGRSEKVSKYLDWITLPFEERYRSISYDLSESIKRRLYSHEFRENLPAVFDEYFAGLHKKVAGKDLLSKMTYIDVKSWLAEDILLKSDRMTMAASVELRAPFLDHELIEFAVSLPSHYKLRNGEGKYILKDVARSFLPNEIVTRRKRGFPVPLTSWFRGELKERAQELLLDRKTISRGYFDRNYVEGIFHEIDKGRDLGRRIFSLLVLELWHRKYIDASETLQVSEALK